MTGPKTNERPGTRAVLRQCRVSAYKVRLVLDLIRGKDIQTAAEILRFSDVGSAEVVAKLLASAVANAEHNDQLDPAELYVSACYADEGTTLKRWRPRARGRATRIRKRTSHVTIIVSRLPEERLRRQRARQAVEQATARSRRASGGRRARRADERSDRPVVDPGAVSPGSPTGAGAGASTGSGQAVPVASERTGEPEVVEAGTSGAPDNPESTVGEQDATGSVAVGSEPGAGGDEGAVDAAGPTDDAGENQE